MSVSLVIFLTLPCSNTAWHHWHPYWKSSSCETWQNWQGKQLRCIRKMTCVLGSFCVFIPKFQSLLLRLSVRWPKCYLHSVLLLGGLERERPLTTWVLKKAFKFFLVLEPLIMSKNFNVYWMLWCQCIVILKLC